MKAFSKSKKITFKIVDPGSRDYRDALALREEILRKPRGRTYSEKELEFEKNNIHVAGFIGNYLCATCDLVPVGNVLKMKRVAVRSDRQSQGIGSSLMKFCEEFAKKNHFESIYCYARTSAVTFYSKNHFRPEGALVDEEGFPHQKMRNTLVQ